MGFLSKAFKSVSGAVGNIFGIESGIGAGVPGVGPGPDVSWAQNLAQKLMEERYGILTDAYGVAQGRTDALSTAGAQRANDSARFQEGGLISRLAGSGLLGGSVAPNLARGIESDRVRSLQENDANVARTRIGLDIGLGEAQANANAGTASLLMDRAAGDRAFFLNREGLRLGRDQFVSSSRQNRAAALGDTINSYIGLAAGGGFQGGGGGGGS